MLGVPESFLKILTQTSVALWWFLDNHASNAASFENVRTDLGLTTTGGMARRLAA
jgi:hypothetical protein